MQNVWKKFEVNTGRARLFSQRLFKNLESMISETADYKNVYKANFLCADGLIPSAY